MRKCPDGLVCKRGKKNIFVVVRALENVEHWKARCTSVRRKIAAPNTLNFITPSKFILFLN